MQLYLTGGTQTTDAAFTPGMLAQLHAVIWAQTWYLRVMDGGAPLIRALAFRRQPMRPGALPFLRRALVLLASLAMLPCTKAADVWWTTGFGCSGANVSMVARTAKRCRSVPHDVQPSPGTGASPSSSERRLAAPTIASSRPRAIHFTLASYRSEPGRQLICGFSFEARVPLWRPTTTRSRLRFAPTATSSACMT